MWNDRKTCLLFTSNSPGRGPFFYNKERVQHTKIVSLLKNKQLFPAVLKAAKQKKFYIKNYSLIYWRQKSKEENCFAQPSAVKKIVFLLFGLAVNLAAKMFSR